MNSDPTGYIVVTPSNIIGAIIGGIIGYVGGNYLANWLANKLGLIGWKRDLFVWGLTGISTASAATIGYFIGPYIAKSWSSIKGSLFSQCFVAGTLVLTDEGNIPIENIQEGDIVYSENPETGEKAYKKVLQTYVNETNTLIHIEVGDEKISTTVEHPFWVIGKGWVFAKDLMIGDNVQLSTNSTMKISSVLIEHLESSIKVYNFEVEDWHTYFVTSSNILVHNACGMSLNKISDSYLKNTLKLDAHKIKYDYLGKNATIKLYDLAYDKKTGIIYIIDKAGKIVTETIYKTK